MIRLAIIATGLSVTVMIIAIGVVSGFTHSVSEKLFGFTGHVHVVRFDETHSNAMNYTEPVYYNRRLADSIRMLPHVAMVAPFAERPVILQAHGSMEGLALKGVNRDYHFVHSISTTGNWIDFSDTAYSKQIILSKTTADRLNINTGDTVQLEFYENGMPRIRRVRVSGLFKSGMEEVDKNFALCDLRLLQRINNWGADSINGYQVDLTENKYADEVASFIHYHLIYAPLEAYTTVDNYSAVFDWLQLISMNGYILLAIMAVVAVINMGAVLLILMVDRATMIGLLKALGMPFEQTRNTFLAIAALIGAAGILLGNVLALGLAWLQWHYGIVSLPEDIYYMHYAPVRIVWWHVAAIDAATLALCVLCMWLPALYIRRVQPARVLQFR